MFNIDKKKFGALIAARPQRKRITQKSCQNNLYI